MPGLVYPFTAVVGQERAKTALILSAIDPRLGGVLISGPKGSGKSTLIRALGDLLPIVEYVRGCPFNCGPGEPSHLCPHCRERQAEKGALPTARRRMRIVELPLGASEDGLLGALDAEAALKRGVKTLQPGLLAKANRSILYIDEVNLLPDHLTDIILDPAASGWNVVQREGVSLVHPSQFTLIASMNPEEGGLRPQILDRFALRVEMDTIRDTERRAELIRRNLAFERDPEAFRRAYEEEQGRLRRRIQVAHDALAEVRVPERVMRGVAEVCALLEVEGFRPDLSIIKGARALAAFEGRGTVGAEDVLRVLDLALSHRVGEGTGEPSRPSMRERLREILLTGEAAAVVEEALPRGDAPHELASAPPFARRRRWRRVSPSVIRLVQFLTVSALLVLLSVVSTIVVLFLQAAALGTPWAEAVRGLTLGRVLINLGVVSSVFALLILLFPRRLRRPVIYLYSYIGSGLERQVVLQQSHAPHEEEGEDREVFKTVNIPLAASLRRLYKMVLGRGAKLFEAARKARMRRRYRFAVERRSYRRMRGAIGRHSKTKARSERGRYVTYELPKRRPWDVALGPTIMAAAPFQPSRRRGGLALKVEVDDIRVKVREARAPITMVLLLDMSESMIASLENVRNAILSMHEMVLKRRDRLGLVIFKGEGATTLQTPTANLSLVVKRLMEVGASDLTPLASGMYEAWRLLRNEKAKNRDSAPYLVIISDGIANIPLEAPL
ncbi:MAG: ATP-binding protein, partial [Candidatus Bathyarchaeia archaeon]